MAKERFEISIPEETLVDPRRRVARTRFAGDFANSGCDYGTNGQYLKELVAYWLDRFDCRAQERAMNAFAHFRTLPRSSRRSLSH